MENEEIKKDELGKVSGGKQDGNCDIYCTTCCKSFYKDDADRRNGGSGCSKYIEYKCPTCGTWVKE